MQIVHSHNHPKKALSEPMQLEAGFCFTHKLGFYALRVEKIIESGMSFDTTDS